MTIREAFEKAGYPVPKYSWLVYWPLPDSSDKYWFYLDHNDPERKCLYWFPHECWEPAECSRFELDELELLRGQIYESIDISSLPAIDALDFLPDAVKALGFELAYLGSWDTREPCSQVVRADLHRKALDRIAFLESALEQAVDFAAMEVLEESEVELDNGELSILPEGLACSHQRLRGTDEYKDLVSHLKEKEC